MACRRCRGRRNRDYIVTWFPSRKLRILVSAVPCLIRCLLGHEHDAGNENRLIYSYAIFQGLRTSCICGACKDLRVLYWQGYHTLEIEWRHYTTCALILSCSCYGFVWRFYLAARHCKHSSGASSSLVPCDCPSDLTFLKHRAEKLLQRQMMLAPPNPSCSSISRTTSSSRSSSSSYSYSSSSSSVSDSQSLSSCSSVSQYFNDCGSGLP